jgi:hydrogenase maturation protein HypF
MPQRIHVRLRGIVQGVGFRPFVYNLARRLDLAGWVLNDSSGLMAEVEGEEAAIVAFLEALGNEHPPLAWIQEREVTSLPPDGERDFRIRPSVAETGKFALISPDIATCGECLADCSDPGNRRHGYAFTNCTNCGPRYTIIRDIPYDRPHTTMADFEMCAECRAEYEDPANRRFHAQPNACPACGPALSAGIQEAQRRLADGEIVAIKGLGGFHLACDARNAAAVGRLRARKRRSDKPFAVMVRDVEAARRLCVVDEAAERALAGPRRPIVILPRAESRAGTEASVGMSACATGLAGAIAPGNPALGVMLPYTPLHHLLFSGVAFDDRSQVDSPQKAMVCPTALVMTSGNLSEEPIVVDNQEARDRLGAVADWFLTHNRDIYMRADDSVVRLFEGEERVMRRSRGYVPETLDVGRDLPELLACGGELKNVFCLTKGTHAILSQHIGDLENYETLVFFEETLANLKKLFRVTPRAVAYDLHPGYLSTKYALGLAGVEKIGVQHHHAHIASCMAENGLTGDVIGVAMDGTGYGLDGAIWGGEFLVASYAGFTRRAHLRYVPLAGGDRAVREPWRSALGYVATGERIAGVPEERVRAVRRMIATGTNTVMTSSCGRLFDAVAALVGLRTEVNFEGQAAIELEGIVDPSCEERYQFDIGGEEIDFAAMMERIVKERAAAPGVVAARFHNTLAAAIHEMCLRMRRESGLQRVCLSGGTFQNMRLLGLVARALRRSGFQLFLHKKVPPNDGGIALGQAAIAAERLTGGRVDLTRRRGGAEEEAEEAENAEEGESELRSDWQAKARPTKR